MFRSITKSRAFPALLGMTIGTAGAIYLQHQYSSNVKAETVDSLQGVKTYVPLPVKSNVPISHDTNEIIVELPDDHKLGGDVASCVLIRTEKDGKKVVRPYTPVSSPDTVGSATFVIKKYPGGVLGTHLHDRKAGESIEIAGPILKYEITPNKHNKIALIGGGSGITPLYQILSRIASDPNDKTKATLYYGSQTPDDILLRKEIDSLVAKKPDQLQVQYFVDKADEKAEFKGKVGYISKEHLEKDLFKAEEDNVHVFVCGPPGLYKALSGNKKSPSDQGELTGALSELGFTKEQVFKF